MFGILDLRKIFEILNMMGVKILLLVNLICVCVFDIIDFMSFGGLFLVGGGM